MQHYAHISLEDASNALLEWDCSLAIDLQSHISYLMSIRCTHMSWRTESIRLALSIYGTEDCPMSTLSLLIYRANRMALFSCDLTAEKLPAVNAKDDFTQPFGNMKSLLNWV